MIVACRCGWLGETSQLLEIGPHERWCPNCNATFTAWPRAELSFPIPLNRGVPPELNEAVNRAYTDLAKNMNQQLYGDKFPEWPKPTRRQRFRAFIERGKDAWLVLRGKAEIGE